MSKASVAYRFFVLASPVGSSNGAALSSQWVMAWTGTSDAHGL